MDNGNQKTGPLGLYVFLILVGLALAGLGVSRWQQSGYPEMLALGALAAIIPAALAPIALRPREVAGGSHERIIELLQSMSERLLISDTAKKIAYREKDRNALREAIRNDIANNDFESALVLADQMGRVYGYREEAENFREQILLAREAEVKRKVQYAIKNLDMILAKRDWPAGVREAARIQRLYPDSEEARGLVRKVRDAREDHKRDLLTRFHAAHDRNDADEAWTLLKELDLYLSEAEGLSLREEARRVIGTIRENLQVQFKLATQDKDFARAVEVGSHIMKEFPNTKMAEEIKVLMPALRERAAGLVPAAPKPAGNTGGTGVNLPKPATPAAQAPANPATPLPPKPQA